MRVTWVIKNNCIYAVFKDGMDADDHAHLFPVDQGWGLCCYGQYMNAYEKRLSND